VLIAASSSPPQPAPSQGAINTTTRQILRMSYSEVSDRRFIQPASSSPQQQSPRHRAKAQTRRQHQFR